MNVEDIDRQIKELRKQKREMTQQYTFNGVYTKLVGRNNLLKEIKETKGMTSEGKVIKAIEKLSAYLDELKEAVGVEITEEEGEEGAE